MLTTAIAQLLLAKPCFCVVILIMSVTCSLNVILKKQTNQQLTFLSKALAHS